MMSRFWVVTALCAVGILGGCANGAEPVPDRAGVFEFGENNWLEAPSWVAADPAEVESVGADFGISTSTNSQAATQIFIEVYVSEYSGEQNRDDRKTKMTMFWTRDVREILPLVVDGYDGHGLTYDIHDPDKIVAEYYFDGESSIYRILIEAPQDEAGALDAAREILTEHTVLNDAG